MRVDASRTVVATAVILLLGSGLAAPAMADTEGTWLQSFGRASEDAECVAPDDQTPWQPSYTGQQTWTPSWAWWPNGGAGGWTCDRWITWATPAVTESSFPTAGCVLLGTQEQGSVDWTSKPPAWGDSPYPVFVDFLGGNALEARSPAYADGQCSQSLADYGVDGWLSPNGELEWDIVYAPGGQEQAAVLCELASFPTSTPQPYPDEASDTWECNPE